MKQKKTIYLYASTSKLNVNTQAKDLKNKYSIVGNSKNINEFYSLEKSSVDYLIIFANRKSFSNLDKHKLNYLTHVFNNIVVVAKTKLNVLKDYIFIPQSLVNNSLYKVLKILESGINKSAIYTYDNFYKHCSTALNLLGFNQRHKGYQYIINCAYNIATINKAANLKLLYKNVAQTHNTTTESVERCIRSAISCAINNTTHQNQHQVPINYSSNKKFIECINSYVISNLL